MASGDTIVALASAPPPAPRVVVRLSGPAAWGAAGGLMQRGLQVGVVEGAVHLKGIAVPAAAWAFAGPRSYTGEDVVELHLPGSPWVVGETMRQLLAQPGVRMATAGEFTARAYLAGKLDLTAAEGVALAVSAADERQLRAARQLLAGTLAGKVRQMSEALATLLALLEAGIDFTDEDVSFIAEDALRAGILDLTHQISQLLAAGAKFQARGEMPVVVLAGRPNAGKSTLMNALLGRERVVVSPVAGTTRDAIFEELQLSRGRVLLADVAGLEAVAEVEGGAVGEVGQVARDMQARAAETLATADVIVHVRDGTASDPSKDPIGGATGWLPRQPDLEVRTKRDLPGWSGLETGAAGEILGVSARTGEGVAAVREALDRLVFGSEGGMGLALNARHVAQLTSAREGLERARGAIGRGDEFVAAGLREALDVLGEITGVISPDDVLGRVFATFCIGK